MSSVNSRLGSSNYELRSNEDEPFKANPFCSGIGGISTKNLFNVQEDKLKQNDKDKRHKRGSLFLII